MSSIPTSGPASSFRTCYSTSSRSSRRAARCSAPSAAISTSTGPPPGEDPALTAWQARLLGVSFSGGGIRSATFNLGVLQALARCGVLRYVDYLSTVSGGGYVGSWLTALCQRRFARRREDAQAAGVESGIAARARRRGLQVVRGRARVVRRRPSRQGSEGRGSRDPVPARVQQLSDAEARDVLGRHVGADRDLRAQCVVEPARAAVGPRRRVADPAPAVTAARACGSRRSRRVPAVDAGRARRARLHLLEPRQESRGHHDAARRRGRGRAARHPTNRTCPCC